MGGSGGALGELWEALAELREALGELRNAIFLYKKGPVGMLLLFFCFRYKKVPAGMLLLRNTIFYV